MNPEMTNRAADGELGDGEITREELVVAIRTLIAAATCWEFRDSTQTARDKKQQRTLGKVVNMLQELNASQASSAGRVIGTLARDEIAVALGASVAETERGPRMGQRDAKSKGKPAALWAHMGIAAQIPGSPVASAIRRACSMLKWLLGRESPFVDPAAAMDLAREVEDALLANKQGPIEAAAMVAFVFDDYNQNDDGSRAPRAKGTQEVAMSQWLLSERHPDRDDLGLEDVDSGRYFGARNSAVRQPDAPAKAGPLEAAAAALAADALGVAASSQHVLRALACANYPGVWIRAMRGAADKCES